MWFLVYQALAVLMYGAVFIAVGAAVSDLKESQSMLMPVMVLIMAPFFVWTSVLKAPTATFAVVVSLIPPATPMLMLLRQGNPTGCADLAAHSGHRWRASDDCADRFRRRAGLSNRHSDAGERGEIQRNATLGTAGVRTMLDASSIEGVSERRLRPLFPRAVARPNIS